MADAPPPDLLAYWLGVRAIDVVAGLGGGLVRGLVNPTYTWPMRLTSAVVGAINAGRPGRSPMVCGLGRLARRGHGSGGIFLGPLRDDSRRDAAALGAPLAGQGPAARPSPTLTNRCSKSFRLIIFAIKQGQ